MPTPAVKIWGRPKKLGPKTVYFRWFFNDFKT